MKIISLIISFIAFIFLISEPELLTITVIIEKILALIFIWLIVKINIYFYDEEE